MNSSTDDAEISIYLINLLTTISKLCSAFSQKPLVIRIMKSMSLVSLAGKMQNLRKSAGMFGSGF